MNVDIAGTSEKAAKSGMAVNIPSWTMSVAVTIQSDIIMKSETSMILVRSLRRRMLMRVKAEMYCPTCDCDTDSDVINSGGSKLTWGKVIWRRRVCKRCGGRFTTYELPASEYKALTVLKQDTKEFEKAIDKVKEIMDKYGGESIDT